MSKKYAIIDIETTGGMVKRDKIIEIAIVLHNGDHILDTYQTLINPCRSIPEFISNMTGISTEMVADAPKFYEVAKDIVQLTEGAVFVAHNARFDYSFIREEFQRLGYTYSRKQLCTIRLARQVYPGLKSYGLDSLINHFGLHCSDRHRAMGDAKATTQFLEQVFRFETSHDRIDDIVNLGIRESRLPENITMERLHALPEETGVYYFHDRYGNIIYVGKSINIKKRVMQHFAKISNKAAKLQRRVFDISYEITGSELIALLLENQEIKKHQPEINRAQRNNAYPWAIYTFTDVQGYIHLKIGKKNKIDRDAYEILHEFPKIASARRQIKRMIEMYALCLNKCDRHTGPGSCFNHKIRKCNGACIGEEPPGAYNIRAEQAILHLKRRIQGSMVIVDAGRNAEEKSIVGIRDGRFCGFGYVNAFEGLSNLESAFDHIKSCPATPESVKIINWYLQDNKAEKVVRF